MNAIVAAVRQAELKTKGVPQAFAARLATAGVSLALALVTAYPVVSGLTSEGALGV